MKVQDIGHAIVKRAWIVIGLVLIAALVAAVIAQVQSPVYKVEIAVSTSAPINPVNKQPDSTAMIGLAALTPAIANYAESISVAEVASARLALTGTDIPPEELLKKVSSTPEANSTSVKITFSDGSPTRVADIANTWGDVLVEKSNTESELYDPEFKTLILNGSMVFTNRAVPPEKPTQPKPLAYVGLGIFAGLVLGLVLVIFIEYFNPRFRSAAEAEETLGLPVMGILPMEKGGRSTSLLPAFGEGSRTWGAYSELRSGLIMASEGIPRSILAVPAIPFEAGPAVAANLAISIANTGRKTLLIDCDLQKRALSHLMEVEDNPGLSDALESKEDLRDKVVAGEVSNLSLLPAGKRSEVSTDLLSLPFFFDELREQEELFDEVVLYGPPLLGSLDSAVVGAQVDACLVVIDSDRCTRKAAAEAMHGFERLGIVPMGLTLANVKVRGRERPRPEREEKTKPAAAPAVKEEKPERKEVAAPAAVKEKKRRKEKAAPPVEPAPTTLETMKPAAAKEVREEPPAPPVAKEFRKEPAAAPAVKEEKPERKEVAAPAAVSAAAAAPVVKEKKEKKKKRRRKEKAAPPVEPAPTTLETMKPAAAKEVREEPPAPPVAKEVREEPAFAPAVKEAKPEPEKVAAPAAAPSVAAGDEIRQVRESVAEDFRRMGEAGAPIPKNWLRALNSDKVDVRDSAQSAITSYYRAFLRRYDIGEDSVYRITESIIRMMRREGEFAAMSEEEAQHHLQNMLVDAGASFQGAAAGGASTRKESGATDDGGVHKDAEKEVRRGEKKRFRLETKGSRRAGKTKGRDYGQLTGEEDSIDWE